MKIYRCCLGYICCIFKHFAFFSVFFLILIFFSVVLYVEYLCLNIKKDLWKRCAANGDIYLDTYKGWYMEREEMFVSAKDAEEWDYKDPSSGYV